MKYYWVKLSWMLITKVMHYLLINESSNFGQKTVQANCWWKKTVNHANGSHCRSFWKNMAACHMIDGRPKREAVAARKTHCLWILLFFFFTGTQWQCGNSCFSAAGKNENALFICEPSIMTLAWRRKMTPLWGVCASGKQHCEYIHATSFICLVWPSRGWHISLKFMCVLKKLRQSEQRPSSS